MTNTWDAANRLINSTNSLTPIYNGVSDRVGQTVESTTTDFALDIAAGLPEVIYTSQSEVYPSTAPFVKLRKFSGQACIYRASL
ncbi:MAG: hypothetical protein H6631_00980 [Anaerolineaceae bacterium]|nr:hypothetical protein [Anaerolineaceae bacterium]MCB9098127.1 hypothetical protein [Anaerolineales bacterium]